ncbi:infPhox [Biomphalaria glabrata]|nr:infPhox [Biomphalaria glabrata]
MGKFVTEVQVINAEKRRLPNKYYVYVILVTWSDGSTLTIYRRYSRFFDLQTKLLDTFPIEGGALDPAQRVIPFLPGKIFFGRSQIKDVAMKRLKELNFYCQKLIELHPKISRCEDVLEFFEVEPEDLEVATNEADEGCPLYVDGMLIGGQDPVISKLKISKDKKADSISSPKRLDGYVAIAEYTALSSGELSLYPGLKVEVLEKNENGWWFVNSEDAQGWVPSTYLEPEGGADPKSLVAPIATPGKEESFICIENFEAASTDELSLEKGAVVQVLQKNLDGWWLVRYKGHEAYAPGTVLKKVSNPNTVSMVEKSQLSGVEIISSLHDVSNLLNQTSRPESQGDRSSHWPGKESLDQRASVIVKQRSLERGGNLMPPPRQNSVNKTSVPSSPTKTNVYVTISDFTDTVGDGLSFKKGQNVFVTEKSNTGWWYVKMGDKEGWVVSSYLLPLPENTSLKSDYELASLDEIDNNNSHDYDDEDWYVEPEDDGIETIPPPADNTAKRPLPALPANLEQPKASKPLPVLPAKKPEGFKLPTPPQKPGVSNNISQPSTKLQDVVLKPVSKPPDPPSKPTSNPVTHSEPQKKAGEERHSVGGSLDLASQLKAKFESRSGTAAPEVTEISISKPGPSKFGSPIIPQGKQILTPKESQESNQSLAVNLKPVPKPPPPSKLKPAGVIPSTAFKPVAQTGAKPLPSAVKPNPTSSKPTPPAPPLKLSIKPESNNNIPTKSNVKNLSSTFGSSSSVEKTTSSAKPSLPGKPKPVLPSKACSSTPSAVNNKAGNQNVNNLVNNLSSKLNFGQSPLTNRASGTLEDKPATSSAKPPAAPKKPSAPAKSNAQTVTPVSPMASMYIAISSFVAENEGELGFSEGDEIEVLEEQNDWSRIRCWDEEGWAPSSYLQKL